MKTKELFKIAFAVGLFTASYTLYGQQQSPTANENVAGSDEPFSKGTNVVNLGVGIGGLYTYWGPGYSSTPNFVISYENGTFGHVGPGVISLGALLSYKGISDNWIDNGYSYSDKWDYWILGFRSAYHWNFTSSKKFDPYLGLMLGYYYVNYMFTTNNPDYYQPGNPGYVYYSSSYPNYLALSMYLGARYYISNKVGIWGELGYGYTTLALGVNFKI